MRVVFNLVKTITNYILENDSMGKKIPIFYESGFCRFVFQMYFEKGDDFSQEEERSEGLHVLGSLTGTHTKK